MEPFLAAQSLLYRDLIDDAAGLAGRATDLLVRVSHAERLHERHRPLLDEAWECLWTSAHRGLLMLGGLRESFDHDVARTRLPPLLVRASSVYGFLTGAMRALWAMAMHGKPMLPMLKRLLDSDDRFASLALVALALRHPRHAAEVRKVLERRCEEGGPVEVALRILSDPEGDAGMARRLAADLAQQWTEHLPAHSVSRWATTDAVPSELHLGLLCRYADSYWEREGWAVLSTSVPLLARAEAADLYLPADVLARFEPQVPSLLVELTDRLRRERKPVSAPPARNGPCPCGSGKKLKRCCGG